MHFQIESILGDLRWFVQSGATTHTENPNQVIENSVKLARHRIQYETEIELNLEPLNSVALSEGKLSQIIINLVFNASKARRIDQTVEDKDLCSQRRSMGGTRNTR